MIVLLLACAAETSVVGETLTGYVRDVGISEAFTLWIEVHP